MAYSLILLNLKDKSIRSIINILRYSPNIKILLWDETSFLNYNANIAERIWYIKNNIYEQVKCPTCNKPTKVVNNKIKYCSFKCNIYSINPETGLIKAKERALKIKKSNEKIDPKTGLTGYQKTGLKNKEKLSKINPKSGLTIAKEIAKKTKKILSKIDPESGLTGYQKSGKKQSITKNKINHLTGKSIAKNIGKKSKKTMSKINPKTGLTKFQEIGRKNSINLKKINPETGLSIISEANKKSSYNRILEKFNLLPEYKLLISLTEYLLNKKSLIKYQHNCGEIREHYHQNQIRCLKCYPYNRSIAENEIIKFCQSLTFNVISNSRTIIKPLELDIYMPDHNLAIEYDGIFWHSSYNIESEDKNIHLRKTQLCLNKNIQLLHIFENEWEDPNKQEIWKSIIKNKLGKSQKIFARKCEIKEILPKDSKIFLENNHLQGQCNSSINIGLFYNNELVSIMIFGKSRFNKKVKWELLRFCNKLNYSVVGAASRLFKNFLKEHTGSVISYADMRRSIGNLYKQLGFELSHESGPNYWYWKNNNGLLLESRIQYQKHKLKDKLEVFDSNLSETENMYNNGYRKIYDCGNQVWIYKI